MVSVSYTHLLKVTKGIDCRLPMIAYNGVFTADYKSGEILQSSFFGGGEKEILPALLDAGISPIVYSYDGKKERFKYCLLYTSTARQLTGRICFYY